MKTRLYGEVRAWTCVGAMLLPQPRRVIIQLPC